MTVQYKKLAISLILPQLAGVLGSLFTAPAIDGWYAGLVKPEFNPPGWIFGPVWITLYILMGISVYLIWSARGKNSKNLTNLFWLHLIFNAMWSVIFFGLHLPGWALINLIIIWIFIVIFIIRFWSVNRWASALLIPYLLWVSFAGVLNYFIWYLN